MPSRTNKVMSIHSNKEFKPQNLSHTSKSLDNSGGGEPPMDKYVTHEELKNEINKLDAKMELNNANLLRDLDQRFNEIDKRFDKVDLKFEKVNTKFEQQKVWFITTAISIVAASCTIIGFLIKFIK